MWYAVCDLHRELSLMLFRPVSVAADDEIFLFFFFFGSKMRQSHIRYPTVQRHSTVRMNRIKIIIIFVVVRIEHYYRIAPLNISRHGMPFCMCFFQVLFFLFSVSSVILKWHIVVNIKRLCLQYLSIAPHSLHPSLYILIFDRRSHSYLSRGLHVSTPYTPPHHHEQTNKNK